jgi:methionyl-tRNA formyltransferase
MKLQASPVKAFALEHGIPVAQPRSLRLDGKYPDDAAAAREALLAARPDVMVVAAYGLLLPPWVLELPRLGCLNIHGSLLPALARRRPHPPRHRGGRCTHGVTIMQMDAGLDTGDMLLVESIPIGPRTPRRPCTTSWPCWVAAGGRGAGNRCLRNPHPHAAARGGRDLRPQGREGGSADRLEPAGQRRSSAGSVPSTLFPGTSTTLDGEPVKIWKATLGSTNGSPGEIVQASGDVLSVTCGTGSVQLLELQKAGGKRLSARSSCRPSRTFSAADSAT